MTLFFLAAAAAPAWAGDLRGTIKDKTGGVIPGATIRLLDVASGAERATETDTSGGYRFADLHPGLYRVAAARQGFSEASRTVVVTDATMTLDFTLEIGAIKVETTALAARGLRDTQDIPLRADALSADLVRALVPASTGDVLVGVPGVTPVGSGPFQIRPRLRGLDSTRVLVLVDGERLNNARTATDRAGVEVGLVDPDSIQGVEVLGGAGSVLFGTDALSGTINIITNRAVLTAAPQLTLGFDGLYSSNESGRRGTVTLGFANRRLAVRFTGGVERFDAYRAGKDFTETSQPLLDDGTITNAGDTIDDAFGFHFGAFPDPFNAPFSRTSAVIGNSGMEGASLNLAAMVALGARQNVEFKYQQRRAENIGFPDFEAPFFFQSITLPKSNLDKASVAWSATDLEPWFTRLSVRGYFQRQDRLLRNDFPVAQFPVPSPGFFPIAVNRINILSDTRQQVWTPGFEVQGTFLPRPNNVLTTGVTLFRDRSEDERSTTTYQNTVGRVVLGPMGPAAEVFATPTGRIDFPTTHPARVPNASFRDLAFFAHDEWTVSPSILVTAGIRVDGYRVTTDPTPGYDVASIVAGAAPAIDPATLPNVNGDRISRTALTGEAGILIRADEPVSFFAHYVRSYRHPNLEELLFSGPATAGNIAPNITVEPETGHNVDAGARLRTSWLSGSLAYFVNTYHGFISTEVVANSPAGSISQAINLARVRIQGVEAQADVPVVAGGLVWAPSASVAWTRGTVLEGESPLSGLSLAGAPQDNITPWKVLAGVRVSDRADHWWGSYNVRSQARVSRVSPLLSESPFLIAQDLFGLGGFAIHRLAAGYEWRRGNEVVGLTLAVDNLTDRYYREQFQFAPARGRSFSVAVHIRGIQ